MSKTKVQLKFTPKKKFKIIWNPRYQKSTSRWHEYAKISVLNGQSDLSFGRVSSGAVYTVALSLLTRRKDDFTPVG